LNDKPAGHSSDAFQRPVCGPVVHWPLAEQRLKLKVPVSALPWLMSMAPSSSMRPLTV
jgi:hypothetical protein